MRMPRQAVSVVWLLNGVVSTVAHVMLNEMYDIKEGFGRKQLECT
jgi:hypothetical protein